MKRGLFIVFEAAPKCGKTTLSLLLKKRLSRCGYPSKWNRGALSQSSFGNQIRQIDLGCVKYSTAFYWSDLIFDTQDFIAPNLESGITVVQDRYDLSIITFREIHNLNYDWLLWEEYIKRKMLLIPDLTVVLDPGFETAQKRTFANPDSSDIDRSFYESEDNYYRLNCSVEKYLKLSKRHFIRMNTLALSPQKCLNYIRSDRIFQERK